MCSFIIHSLIQQNFSADSVPRRWLLSHITGSLSRAGVSWPAHAFLPLPFSTGRSRWREAYEHDKVQGEMEKGEQSRGHGLGSTVSSDPIRHVLGKLAEQKDSFLCLCSRSWAHGISGAYTREASQLSAAAAFKPGKQQEAGWLLQVVSCLSQEASGNLYIYYQSLPSCLGSKRQFHKKQ